MEFLLYLSPHGQQLIRDLISAKFHIHENVGICQKHNVLGAITRPNKFIVCTKNIKNNGLDPYVYVSETVYHEAAHAAQICNGDRPIGIPFQSMPIPERKQRDVMSSLKASGNPSHGTREHEAYYLEDKPLRVQYYVRKFCF